VGISIVIREGESEGVVPGVPNRVSAAAYCGGDIGAKVNAACGALVALGGGIVEIPDGDFLQTTKVIIPPNVTVLLGSGTISTSIVSSSTPHWLLKDNSSLMGRGLGSKLMTPVFAPGDSFAVAVGDYNTWPDNDTQGNSNIRVADLQIIGNPSSTYRGSQSAAIQVGNVTNCTIERCLIHGVEGYGIFQVGSSVSGHFADGFNLFECTFENVETQHAGIINARNFRICRNVFRPTTAKANFTVIDCEINSTTDSCAHFQISDNIFDLHVEAIPFDPGAMIQMAGSSSTSFAETGRVHHGVISGNVCLSGAGATHAYLQYGIRVAYADDIIIANNVVAYCSVPIDLVASNSCIISGNKLEGGLNDDAQHVLLEGTMNTHITDNVCTESNGPSHGRPLMVEAGWYDLDCDYNIFSNNKLAYFPYSNPTANGGRDVQITLIGANSRVFNSFMGPHPIPTDAPLAINLTELKALPIPGARASGNPPVTMVGGHAGQADGGHAIWRYDPLEKRSDNGLTVIEPDYHSGDGRWLRAPQMLKLTTTERGNLVLSSDDAGFMFWNTSTLLLNYWDGTQWMDVTAAASAVTFSMEGLNLSGRWKADFTGVPWAGTPSAGSSGSHSLVSWVPPAVPPVDLIAGSPVNGLTPAKADTGASALSLDPRLPISAFFTAGAGTILMLVKPLSAAAPGATPFNEPGFMGDNNGAMTASFSTSGFGVGLNDGTPRSFRIPCSTGAYHLLEMKWNGAHLIARVDSGDRVARPCGKIGNMFGTSHFGGNAGGGYLDWECLEALWSPVTISDTDCDNIKAYMNATYALSL
jgi:hypothetical protein